METKEILENFAKYKNQFGKEKFNLSFDEFERVFYAQDFFLNKTTPYLEELFYETTLQIVNNILKHSLQDLEYYVNVKPQTPLTSSDSEILRDKKDILKIYFKMHILFKKLNLLWIQGKENTDEVIDFASESYKIIIEFKKVLGEVQTKLIKNLEKKLNAVDEEKKEKFDSSIFN